MKKKVLLTLALLPLLSGCNSAYPTIYDNNSVIENVEEIMAPINEKWKVEAYSINKLINLNSTKYEYYLIDVLFSGLYTPEVEWDTSVECEYERCICRYTIKDNIYEYYYTDAIGRITDYTKLFQ